MANDKVIIEIDLGDGNVKRVLGRIQKDAEEAGNGVGDNLGKGIGKGLSDIASKVSGFISSFGSLASVAAVAAASGFAIKKAFDLAQQGEQIDQINNQFEVLSSRAGIAADVFRDQLVTAAQGLGDTEAIIQAASTALGEMGSNAAKLPEILNLARITALRFGGDVESNFQKINQAIITGTTKPLRELGIFVKAEDAIAKYAKANGRAASEVSAFGRQQAITNAILEAGQRATAGFDETQAQVTASSKRLSVSIGEIGDAFAKLSQSAFGNIFSSIADGLSDLTLALTGLAPETQTQLRKIDSELSTLEASLLKVQEQAKSNDESLKKSAEYYNRQSQGQVGLLESLGSAFSDSGVDARFYQSKIETLGASIEKLKAKRKSLTDAMKPDGTEDESLFDNQKRIEESLKNQENFNKEILRIQNESQAQFFERESIGATIEEQQQLKTEQAYFDHKNRLKAIEDQFLNERGISNEMFNGLVEQENLRSQLAIETINKDFSAKILDDKKKKEEAAAEIKRKSDQLAYSATVDALSQISTLQESSSAELVEIGKAAAITKATMDGYVAVQNALANVPYPFNFAAAAAVGIAAAANVAKIAAVGGGGSSASQSFGTPGGNPVTLPTPDENTVNPDQAVREPDTNVSVTINGDVLDSDETSIRIVDLLNEAFDKKGVKIRRTALA